jgi:hypothetical protein
VTDRRLAGRLCGGRGAIDVFDRFGGVAARYRHGNPEANQDNSKPVRMPQHAMIFPSFGDCLTQTGMFHWASNGSRE